MGLEHRKIYPASLAIFKFQIFELIVDDLEQTFKTESV